MEIRLPEKAEYIIETLTEHGYEAYAVGGCVRDSLLSRTPGDWDITTSAKPEEVKALFGRGRGTHTVDTGIQHGTVTVMVEREGFEVTTYRIDGEYADARHPKEVLFTSDLLEDLRRRDFTINAMAYNKRDGLVDAFDGISDLRQGVIRCVGNAEERFTEDALRMLRAVRFSAQLGFGIEEGTRDAIKKLSGNIAKVSAERISAELLKLLLSKHPEELLTAYETGLTGVFLPEFDVMMQTAQNNPHHCYSVGVHTIEAVKRVPAEKALRLTMLLHDVAKPACRTTDKNGIDHFYGHPAEGSRMANDILRRLKFDNETIDRVKSLILWHDHNPELKEASVRRAVSKIGTRHYPALFEVKRADIGAQSLNYREEKLSYVDRYEQIYEEILKNRDCLTLKQLAVTGTDLINAGMKPGKEIGELLSGLLSYVLEDPERNTKENLLEQAHKLRSPFI